MTNRSLCGLVCAGLLGWTVCVRAATRVALVSTCEGEGGQQALALAEAELSSEPGIALVERSEVDRVLREQNLWQCGLSSYDQAVAAGQLLGVEVFAAMETLPNEKEALGLVCFSAVSGARLMDVLLPAGTSSNAIHAIVATVLEACAKQQQPDLDRHTICVLSVRNAGLPRGLDGVCESIGHLLERRLLGSQSLAVLERARLDQINHERALSADLSGTNGLAASMMFLELEFTRGASSNEMHVLLQRSNAAGQVQDKIQTDAPLERPADLVESLSGQLLKSIKAGPILQKYNRKAEAGRFSREANFFHENGQVTAALQAAEAAVALDPDNKYFQMQLSIMLLGKAAAILGSHSPFGTDKLSAEDSQQLFALAYRGAQLHADLITAMPIKLRANLMMRLSPDRAALYGFMQQSQFVSEGFDAESQARYTELQALCRHIYVDLGWQSVFASIKTETDLSENSNRCIADYLTRLDPSESTSANWTSDTLDGLNFWLARVNQVGMCRVNHSQISWILAPMLYRFCYPNRQANIDYYRHRWTLKAEDLKRLGGFFEKLKQHPEPFLQLYGLEADLANTLRRESDSSESAHTEVANIMSLGQTIIANPGCLGWEVKVGVYQMLLDVCDLIEDSAWRQKERTELFEFMVARGEYDHWVVLAAVDPRARQYAAYQNGTPTVLWGINAGPPATDTTSYARNLEKLITLLASPKVQKLIDAPQSFDQQLADLCELLGVQKPGSKVLAPWSSAKLLFSGFSGLAQPRIVGDALWAVDHGRFSDARARLVRIPLDGGKTESYDHIPLPGFPDRQYAFTDQTSISIFPPGDAAFSRLSEANGLPSGTISAAVCCDGELYVAIGGDEAFQKVPGYLVKCDLKTGVIKMLASSLRQEKQSPLDGSSPPFLIRQMLADPARHRVLFTVDIGQSHRGQGFTGLWSLNTTTDELKLLLPLDAPCEWVSPVHGNEILLVRRFWGQNSLITYNLESGKGEMIYSTDWLQEDQYLTGETPPPTIPSDTHYPYLMVNGWLWSGAPFCRILTNGVPREFLPSFTGNKIAAVQYLEPVNGGRQILAGVNDQLWLLTMPATPAQDKP